MYKSAVWAGSGCMAVFPISGSRLISPPNRSCPLACPMAQSRNLVPISLENPVDTRHCIGSRILPGPWIAERSHRNWPPLSKHAEEGADDAREGGGFCSGPLRPAVSRARAEPGWKESRRMPSHDVDRISRVEKCNPNVVHLDESAMFSYSIPSDEMIRTVRFG